MAQLKIQMRKILSGSTFILLALLLITSGAAAAQKGGTLIVGFEAEASDLDIHAGGGGVIGRQMPTPFYDALVEAKFDGSGVRPVLAERWEISEDGKVYTFYLRKGVAFHDGTPFNAKAVKFNYDRILDKNNAYHKALNFAPQMRRLSEVIKYEVVDDYTFRMTLRIPLSAYLEYLSTSAGQIVSPTALEKHGPRYLLDHAVGTGPFRFVRWDKGERLVMERNPDYWDKTRSYPDKIIMTFIPEGQGRVAALQAGQVNFIQNVPPDSVDILRKNPSIKIIELKSRHIWYGVMNLESFKPFKDKRVRQAMNYAINKEVISKDILRNTGFPSKGMISSGFGPWENKRLKGYPHNPEKAKQLLSEAGYPDGFECNFVIPASGSGMQDPVAIATMIQADLATVGVKANIQTYEWGAFQKEYLMKGRFQLSCRSWSSIVGDPDNPMYSMFHSSQIAPKGWNTARYSNPEYDKIVEEARAVTDSKKRKALYDKAQEIIVEDAPFIFVDHGITIVAVSKKVHGFQLHPNFNHYFEGASVED